MLVRRPDRPHPFVNQPSRPGVIATPRNPGAFQGWGPKL